MYNKSSSTVDFESFTETLTSAIDNARSLDEIQNWIELQKYVESVQIGDYLLKSNPPQRDLIVAFRIEDGSKIDKVVNIFDLGNQQFRFHKLRDL